jgi:predicted ATP-dependent endonuclease of OLD family
MIAGIFLRNFKIYENFNFVPFTNGTNEKLNLLIGNNGAGKSSVLEALDTFFNERDFVVNSNARPINASIAPIFLIPREKLFSTINNGLYEFADILNEIIWEDDFSFLYASNPTIEQFVIFREELKSKKLKETNFLLLFGILSFSKEITLITFERKIQEEFEEKFLLTRDEFKRNIFSLYQAVKDIYKYIYIPVETSINDFLKLENQGMQSLMDKDLKNEIEKILQFKFQTEGKGEQRKTKRSIPIISFINERLEDYVSNIETSIQMIDTSYHFNNEIRARRVGVKDFAEVIIDTYFTKRRLQKDGKDIANLSSGERKKALIDIAYAFISQNAETEQEIILAIDEPETSLHISMCYEQYERIEEIANKFKKQLFVTSHWYGGLPVLNEGRLYHVEKNDDGINLEIFSLENYFEERGSHPNDVNLKSFYDLTSSIVSAIRNKGTNWLIVEGKSDKFYLEHYLPEDLNIKILPVGGCTIVKKIYEYLYLPINASEEAKDIIGKVFCLIDTDKRSIDLELPSETKNKKLQIRRFQVDDDKEQVKLIRISDPLNTETELEEILIPQLFYEAITSLIDDVGNDFTTSCGTETIKELTLDYEFEIQSKYSFIKGTETIFKSKKLGRNFSKDMKEIHIFFDANKDLICKKYLSIEKTSSPIWIKEIIKYFT